MADQRLPPQTYEELVAENAELHRQLGLHDERIASLEAKLADLERRMGQNSGNSVAAVVP